MLWTHHRVQKFNKPLTVTHKPQIRKQRLRGGGHFAQGHAMCWTPQYDTSNPLSPISPSSRFSNDELVPCGLGGNAPSRATPSLPVATGWDAHRNPLGAHQCAPEIAWEFMSMEGPGHQGTELLDEHSHVFLSDRAVETHSTGSQETGSGQRGGGDKNNASLCCLPLLSFTPPAPTLPPWDHFPSVPLRFCFRETQVRPREQGGAGAGS